MSPSQHILCLSLRLGPSIVPCKFVFERVSCPNHISFHLLTSNKEWFLGTNVTEDFVFHSFVLCLVQLTYKSLRWHLFLNDWIFFQFQLSMSKFLNHTETIDRTRGLYNFKTCIWWQRWLKFPLIVFSSLARNELAAPIPALISFFEEPSLVNIAPKVIELFDLFKDFCVGCVSSFYHDVWFFSASFHAISTCSFNQIVCNSKKR